MSEASRYRLGIISDIHAAPVTAEPYAWQNTVDLPHSVDLLDAGISWLARQRLDALALLGDLTETADLESFAVTCERALSLDVPVMAVPGNCDVDPVDPSLTAFQKIQNERLTISPALLPLPSCGRLELVHLAPEPGSKGLRGVRPYLNLPANDIHLMLTHYPVLDLEPELTAAGFRYSGNLTNRAEIEQELRTLEVPVIVVHGHLHVHDAHIDGALLHLSCGPLIEAPHLVSVIDLEIAGERIAVHRRAHSVRYDDIDRLPIFTPLAQTWFWSGDEWLSWPVTRHLLG